MFYFYLHTLGKKNLVAILNRFDQKGIHLFNALNCFLRIFSHERFFPIYLERIDKQTGGLVDIVDGKDSFRHAPFENDRV